MSHSLALDTGGCELTCGGWELNTGPLQEQQVLLTVKPLFHLPLYHLRKTNQYIANFGKTKTNPN